MKYKLVRLDKNNPNDVRFINRGLKYKLVTATQHDIEIMHKIEVAVELSRKALRGIYSGNLSDDEFNAALLTLERNDTDIQNWAEEIGIEMSYLNPWHDGQGFIED